MFKKFHFFFLFVVLNINASAWAMIHVVPTNAVQSKGDIFIDIVKSKSEAYVGEAFTVKYILYYCVPVIDPQTEINLKFANCYQEVFKKDLSEKKQVIGGKIYNSIVLSEYLIIAKNAGELNLPSIKIQIKTNGTSQGDFFEQEELITKTVSSTVASMKINQLPIYSGKDEFSGIVGDFTIKGKYNKAPTTPNLLLFQMTIIGIGNTKMALFTIPKLPFGLNSYNAETISSDKLISESIQSSVKYSFQLAGDYKGKYNVPPFHLTYFNPRVNQYLHFISDPFIFEIENGPAMPDLKNLSDKRNSFAIFQKLNDDNSRQKYPALYLIVFGIGLMFFIESILNSKFISNYLQKLRSYYITQKAKHIALTNIKYFKKKTELSNNHARSNELDDILYKYMNHTNNGVYSSFEIDKLIMTLPSTSSLQIHEFLNKQHQLRFKPRKESLIDVQNQCAALTTIIKRLAKSNVRFLRIILVALFFTFSTAKSSTVQNIALFESSNQMLLAKNYAEALKGYQRLEAAKLKSKSLYSNMGYLFFKTARPGMGILYFEKALLLAPGSLEVKKNRNIILNKLNKAVVINNLSIESKREFDRKIMDYAIQIIVFITVMALIFYIALRFRKSQPFFQRICQITVIIMLLSATLLWNYKNTSPNFAVVVKRVSAYAGPSVAATINNNLFEGHLVEVIQKYGNWVEIKTYDDKISWVLQDKILVIN